MNIMITMITMNTMNTLNPIDTMNTKNRMNTIKGIHSWKRVLGIEDEAGWMRRFQGHLNCPCRLSHSPAKSLSFLRPLSLQIVSSHSQMVALQCWQSVNAMRPCVKSMQRSADQRGLNKIGPSWWMGRPCEANKVSLNSSHPAQTKTVFLLKESITLITWAVWSQWIT